jgi:tripartite-type tricarboxylate transporter receptor subunit TctC
MMTSKLKAFSILLGSISLFNLDGHPAGAQGAGGFPDGTVRIIVGSAPGGSTDAVARIVAAGLAKKWGHPVVVENREGAMNTIATEYVARSQPNGKTLLMASPQHTQAPSQMALKYDAVKGFAPITMTTTYPTFLVVNTDRVPVNNTAEFIKYAKANPGKLNFGDAGKGSGQYRNGAILMQRAGIKMENITYTGGAPTMVALMGGEIDATFSTYSGLNSIDRSKVRVLGTTSEKRFPLLPDVPALAEAPELSGFDEFDWHGLLAPAGTPDPIVQKIRNDIAEILQEPQSKEMLGRLGLAPLVSTPAEFSKFIAEDVAKWGAFFKALKS